MNDLQQQAPRGMTPQRDMYGGGYDPATFNSTFGVSGVYDHLGNTTAVQSGNASRVLSAPPPGFNNQQPAPNTAFMQWNNAMMGGGPAQPPQRPVRCFSLSSVFFQTYIQHPQVDGERMAGGQPSPYNQPRQTRR